MIKQALASTTRLSSFVLFILIGARVFSLTFYGVNGHVWVEHLLTSLPGGEVGFLIVVNILVFFLAFFLDFFELAFIIVPLLAPAADKLGIDLIWFGVLLGVNMQTSFMHPPFGFALFYLRSVAARVPYLDRVTGKTDRSRSPPARSTGAPCPSSASRCIMVGADDRLPADGDALQGQGRRSGQRRDRRAAASAAVAASATPASALARHPSATRRRPIRRAPADPRRRPPIDLSQPPSFN